MARNRARLSKAITLKMVKPFMPWAPGAYAAFDFQNDRAIWTRQNILTYSGQLDNAAWASSGITVTVGQADPLGGTSAALIQGTSASEIFRRASADTVISGATYTYSVALKRGNFDWVRLIVADGTAATNGVRVWFDLANGVAGTHSNSGTGYGYVSKSIAALGGGWYLCSVTVTAPTTTICVFSLSAASDGSTTRADVGSGAGVGTQYYISRPQLEAGTEATAYILTTAAATNGNPERLRNLAATPNWTFTRASTGYALDLAGNLVSFASGALRRTDRGVLIEGARTNVLLRSQEFDNASWTSGSASGAGPSVVANNTTAPDGTLTADKLIAAAGSTAGNVYQTPAMAALTAHTESVYAKAAEWGWVALETRGESADAIVAWFNLSAGTVGTVGAGGTATIERLANGWYRCTLQRTTGATTSSTRARIYPTNADNTYSTPDGTSGIYIWGAQLEAASFASSYIPTTTASVTRAADALTITGVSGITYPLTLFGEAEWSATSGSIMQVDAGSSVDRVVLSVETGQVVQASMTSGGAGQGGSTSAATIAAGQIFKAAGRYGTNTIRLCLNAVLASEDVSATVPAQPNAVRIGMNHSSVAQGFVYLKRLAIWTSAFTDAQLQTQSS